MSNINISSQFLYLTGYVNYVIKAKLGSISLLVKRGFVANFDKLFFANPKKFNVMFKIHLREQESSIKVKLGLI